jgi:type I restriction-modification system DNA methylase subunit
MTVVLGSHGALSVKGAEGKIREACWKDLQEAVIGLGQTFYGTQLAAQVLFHKKERKDQALFITDPTGKCGRAQTFENWAYQIFF